MSRTEKIAVYGIFTALALVFGYVEMLLPIYQLVPGMKLGLANIVILIVLYMLDIRGAVIVDILRIMLSAALFGNSMALIYSLVGGILSLIGMILLKKIGKFRIITVSIAGAVLHNLGQILVAIVLLDTVYIAYYFVVLWFVGIISGALIGILGAILCKSLKKVNLMSRN